MIEAAFEGYLSGQSDECRKHPLAALGRKLAAQLDERPSALMAKEFRETCDRLRELFPPTVARDRFDELQARRNRKPA